MSLPNIIDSNFLTYIAGILVPVTEISITAAFNAIPTATIELPPYPQLFGIGRQDRVPVHIFHKDPITKDYVLLFEGEISSFSYNDAVFSRGITINAQGLLAFLQDVTIKFLTNLNDVASAEVPGAKDTAYQKFTPNVTFPHSLFAYGLGDASPNNLIKVPYQYLENIINFISGGGTSGSSMGAYNNSVLAEFYAQYCEKIKLDKRTAPLPYFDDPASPVWPPNNDGSAGAFPLMAGMQKETALNQLVGLANAGLSGGSVSHLLNFVVNQLEYEFVTPMAPAFVDDKLVSVYLKPMFYDSLPPECNIIYRSQVLNMSTMEKVYAVPTRVRTMDIQGIIAKLAQGTQSVFSEYGMIDYYPTNLYAHSDSTPKMAATQQAEPAPNYIATELLEKASGAFDSEEFTGPWVYETAAPSWMSFLGPAAIGGDRQFFKARLLARLLMHKQFEARTLQVSSALNTYIVPGHPGVVYDSNDVGFVFCGHVYSVTHSISKNNMSTSVEMGFVRLVEEQIAEPVQNPVPSVDDVVKDATRMTHIYDQTIGSSAVDWEEVSSRREASEEQSSPLAAYLKQCRRIVNMDEYLTFMGMTKEMGFAGEDEEVPVVLYGDFVEKRRGVNKLYFPPFEGEEPGEPSTSTGTSKLEGIRDVLKTIAEREFSKRVYADTPV